MKDKKYVVFNEQTMRYERLQTSFKQILIKYLSFFFTVIFTSIIFTILIWYFWDGPRQKIKNMRVQVILDKYEQLGEKVKSLENDMQVLEKRDNEVYRSIFQAPLVSDSMRISKQDLSVKNALMSEDNIFEYLELKIYTLHNRLAYQKKSYDYIQELVKNKEYLLLATPAIQPIRNKDLTRIASGFGYRIDPIYKTEKFHEGLDFSAPMGTPIYATADGKIIRRELNAGYGNYVMIDHGYGYQTLYGHMRNFNVKVGQKVRRGEVIGFVGSTGKSVGPHCHYEVIKNHIKVDPVYYFYKDLTPEQFEKIVRMAQVKNQSID